MKSSLYDIKPNLSPNFPSSLRMLGLRLAKLHRGGPPVAPVHRVYRTVDCTRCEAANTLNLKATLWTAHTLPPVASQCELRTLSFRRCNRYSVTTFSHTRLLVSSSYKMLLIG